MRSEAALKQKFPLLLASTVALLCLSACKDKNPGQDLKDELLKIDHLQRDLRAIRGSYSYSQTEIGYTPPTTLPFDFFYKANESRYRVTACVQDGKSWVVGKTSISSGCVSVTDAWDSTWAKAEIDNPSMSAALGVDVPNTTETNSESGYRPSFKEKFRMFGYNDSGIFGLLGLGDLLGKLPFFLIFALVGFFLLRSKGVSAGTRFLDFRGRGDIREPHFKLNELSFDGRVLKLKGNPFFGPIPSAGTVNIEITAAAVKVERDQPTFNGGYHYNDSMTLGESVQASVYQEPASLPLRVLAGIIALGAVWLFAHEQYGVSVVMVVTAAISLWYAQLKAGIMLRFLGKESEFHLHFQSTKKGIYEDLTSHIKTLYPRLEGK